MCFDVQLVVPVIPVAAIGWCFRPWPTNCSFVFAFVLFLHLSNTIVTAAVMLKPVMLVVLLQGLTAPTVSAAAFWFLNIIL